MPLPKGPDGFQRILRTGVLPHSTERDDEILAEVLTARRRSTRLPRRSAVNCLVLLGVSCGLAVWFKQPALVLGLAAIYLPVPFLARVETKRRLDRYRRIEAHLDGRRDDARST